MTVVKVNFADLGYSVVPAFLSALAEPAIAVMVACAICSRPLFDKFIPRSWSHSIHGQPGGPHRKSKSYGPIDSSSVQLNDGNVSGNHSATAYAEPYHSHSLELADLPEHGPPRAANYGRGRIRVHDEVIVS